MNAKYLAIAAVAALSAFGAHADEADGSQRALQFNSSRTRSEVMTEALNPVKITNGGTGVMMTRTSGLQTKDVRAQAAAALRAGQTSQGEIGLM